jgi:Coenzyme PQQ synthesis protein D (PqqD)
MGRVALMDHPSTVDLSSRWWPSPDVLVTDVDGEAVLLDLKTEQYHGLNRVGTRIWQLLADRSPLATILETLQNEYQVDPGRLQVDLLALVVELSARGMIVREET